MKNILIIAQARVGSTRLPGKVLKKVLDKPLLWYLSKRIENVKTPNTFVIATVDSKSNLPIIEFAKTMNINYFAGSEDDVLDRYYQTAKEFNGDIIVRITSDCPLTDPEIIDRGLEVFLEGNYDYVSNLHPETYPNGFDIEIISFDALEKDWNEAKLPFEREHVTPYITKNSNKFLLKNFENDVNLDDLHLAVDTKEDFLLISEIINHFYENWTSFKMADVIIYLATNPELLKINAQFHQYKDKLKFLKKD